MIDNQSYKSIVYCDWEKDIHPENFFGLSVYVISELDSRNYGIWFYFEGEDETFKIGEFDEEDNLDGFGI